VEKRVESMMMRFLDVKRTEMRNEEGRECENNEGMPYSERECPQVDWEEEVGNEEDRQLQVYAMQNYVRRFPFF
jgi:hypothetical protein